MTAPIFYCAHHGRVHWINQHGKPGAPIDDPKGRAELFRQRALMHASQGKPAGERIANSIADEIVSAMAECAPQAAEQPIRQEA